MSESFVFSKTLPLYSIINPIVESRDYLDVESPFSFFDFLKYTKAELTPLQFNNLYVDYIKEWNTVKEKTQTDTRISIHDRYVELLKEITVKYTTLEEKRFISSIDYDDELDLDVVLPFFSKKISEICEFYSNKREKLKFKIQKNKIKGTPSSIEKAITDNLTDVLFSDQLEVATYQDPVTEKELLDNLDIEIEELYDIYTSYLDNNPNQSYTKYEVKTELRQKFYTSNLNDIDSNIFLNIDKAIAEQIFKNIRIFLIEIGKKFTINYNFDEVDLNCKPNEKLYDLVTSGKSKASRLVELRNRLIKKYIGSDFYYIQTNSTKMVENSGVLFKADNPSGNLLNRHFPTTATIEEESDLQSCRRIGLFFTPEKNSILYYSVPNKKYVLDESKLEANKVYIYPDPDRYGNTIGLSKILDTEYPLIHICDYTDSLKNQSQGYVEGDIDATPYIQDYYAYFSRNQLSDNRVFGKEGLKNNFSSIYNRGILTNWASDIYGNQYGLFKYKQKKNLVDNSFIVNSKIKECENYDGGPITFYEGSKNLPEIILASNPSWVKPNVWQSDYYYNLLIEAGIGNKVNGLMERGMYWTGYAIEGLYIDRSKLTYETFDLEFNKLLEKELAVIDGLTINQTGITYEWEINPSPSWILEFDKVIDGLFYHRNPKNNLKDTPPNTLDGNPPKNLTNFQPNYDRDYILSSIKYKEFDAGLISDGCETVFDFEEQSKFIINEVLIETKTIVDEYTPNDVLNPYEIKKSFGEIYVRNVVTGEVSHISAALGLQFVKYNNQTYNNIKHELYNKVLDFNIYNDFFWIRTKEYMLFDKIAYNTNQFINSGTGLNFLRYKNENDLSEISNPFVFENRTYCMLVGLSGINTKLNSYSIIPTFYKVDYTTAQTIKIQFDADLNIFKNDQIKNPVKLVKINQPSLAYNTRNDLYCMMCTIEDLNEFAYVYQIKFNYDGMKIFNIQVKLYNFDQAIKVRTINFYDSSSFEEAELVYNDTTNNTQYAFEDGELTLF